MNKHKINCAITEAEFFSLANAWHAEEEFIWLDSNLNCKNANYSYLAVEPSLKLNLESNSIRWLSAELKSEMPTEYLSNAIGIFNFLNNKFETLPQTPYFLAGWIFIMSYDYACQKLQESPLSAPFQLNFYEAVLVWNKANNSFFISALNENAAHKLQHKIKNSLLTIPQICSENLKITNLKAELEKQDYLNRITRIKEHIQLGDIYQMNFTYRFNATITGDPFQLYLALRKHNPAPYSAYLNIENKQILCSSPELFIELSEQDVMTRPIKGTRPRFEDVNLDEQAAKELASSEKENAELTMIVDLERNDFSRVALPGSVSCESPYKIEKYARVQHLVATISAKLADKHTFIDLLEALMPGGSISGAPKARALEIITAQEKSSREFYTGILGYYGLNHKAKVNILIRTIEVHKNKLSFGVGGGITSGSDAEAEYQETLDKAAAMIAAINEFI